MRSGPRVSSSDSVSRSSSVGAERELDHRHAGGGGQGVALLLREKVGGMVGGYGVDAASGQEFAQEGDAVGGFLDGGIAFDAGAKTVEVVAVEEEILGACLGCHSDAVGLGFADEGELVGGGDVADVETGAGGACESDGAAGGFDAGFARTDVGVAADGDGAAALGGELFAGGADDGLVLGVDGDDGGGFAEEASEGVAVIDEHVAGRGAEEELDACYAAIVGCEEFGEIVVGGADEESVVCDGDFAGAADFVVYCLAGDCGGPGVGHVDV